jgi:hypothetical protein
MPPKQRQIRIEQRGVPVNLMEQLQTRSDEQLEAETRYRSIAMAILGTRAAERYDAAAARSYFQRAIAAGRPQERMMIKRMADASLALAERRADDLKEAVEKLGQAPPTTRQLLGLRFMGVIAPPRGSGILTRLRGIGLGILLAAAILGLGTGIVMLVALPFGGESLPPSVLLGVLLDIVAIAILTQVGRRKQRAARAKAGLPT